MRRYRNLKIVATLGPASDSYETIRALFEAGADVFRLNMSHGDHDSFKNLHTTVRRVEEDVGRPIAILADIQGPKLRCGVFANGSEMLEEGQFFRFDLDEAPGDSKRVCLPHREILDAVIPGTTLLVNDGKVRLEVEKSGSDFAECRVVTGGEISDRKGVNVPDVVLSLTSLTEKDREDLEFACSLGVDWVALSFVQRAKDVEEARDLVNGRAAIMTKVEKPAAVRAFDDILSVSDGIMVARGDLGVELPVQNVPPIQKQLVRKSRAAAKPVIIATQMLESMITSPVPTRAEVSDVATAIYEGVDAVMLSAESAAGRYPVEAVSTMNNVAIEVEDDPTYRDLIAASRDDKEASVAVGIVSAAREIAETTDIKVICCFTQSGTTAALVARERPVVPIIGMAVLRSTARRLCLTWGTHCIEAGEMGRFRQAVVHAVRAALADSFAAAGDQIVITAGVPFNEPGTTNILRVAPCDERLIYQAEPE